MKNHDFITNFIEWNENVKTNIPNKLNRVRKILKLNIIKSESRITYLIFFNINSSFVGL